MQGATAPTNVNSSAVVDDYSADSLTVGAISSWAPVSGSNLQTATVANATSGSAGARTYHNPTVANTGATEFNGHKYVAFTEASTSTLQGLATSNNLGLTGAASMSLAVVYAEPASSVNIASIAGWANVNATSASHLWFDLQDRTEFAAGDPYLANFGNDLTSSGASGAVAAPDQNVITFSLATYQVNSASSLTETLYWAYGLSGPVHSVTQTVSFLDNLTTDNFEIGYDTSDANQGYSSGIDVAQVVAYNQALSASDAAAEIVALQAFYAPEPSTYALLGASLLGGLFFLRRRRTSL